MRTLQQQITEKFLEELTKTKEIEISKVEQLGVLMAMKKKPKADDFVKIFSPLEEGDSID